MSSRRAGSALIAAGIAGAVGGALLLLLGSLGVPVSATGAEGLTPLLPVLAAAAAAAAQASLADRPPVMVALLTGVAVVVVVSLALVVLGGLGSGDPLLGPSLALALLATPTPWVLAIAQAVAAGIVAGLHRTRPGTASGGRSAR